MEKLLESCLEKYKELAQVKEIRHAPTPFLTEDHSSAPARAAGKGPCVDCPWCRHTFPPKVYERVAMLEKAKAKGKNPAADTDAEQSSDPATATPSEEKGKLAPIASKVLMKVLWAARLARFDLLRAVCALAQNVSKWTAECDRKLTRLMGYVAYSKSMRTFGWVGDDLSSVQPHTFADAAFAGCAET